MTFEHNYLADEFCGRRFVISNVRAGVQNSMKAPFVFVRKGIRNLKCYVASTKSLVLMQMCSGEHTLNQHV